MVDLIWWGGLCLLAVAAWAIVGGIWEQYKRLLPEGRTLTNRLKTGVFAILRVLVACGVRVYAAVEAALWELFPEILYALRDTQQEAYRAIHSAKWGGNPPPPKRKKKLRDPMAEIFEIARGDSPDSPVAAAFLADVDNAAQERWRY